MKRTKERVEIVENLLTIEKTLKLIYAIDYDIGKLYDPSLEMEESKEELENKLMDMRDDLIYILSSENEETN
ncbi:MAG: hypothetical protein ACOC1O_00045 [bacterium]